jgi:hypothetical protein
VAMQQVTEQQPGWTGADDRDPGALRYQADPVVQCRRGRLRGRERGPFQRPGVTAARNETIAGSDIRA